MVRFRGDVATGVPLIIVRGSAIPNMERYEND
jgi:hypothetical protein